PVNLSESQQVWIDVLHAWFQFGLEQRDFDVMRLGKELLPFFVLRAVQFWFLSEPLTADETEAAIQDQAEKLRTILRK
ncbi:hypothetical protein K2Q00_02390, partial [Patescibacteria group bacterium]|nr:hypothetical protein [Patescibacteria group bacterium]